MRKQAHDFLREGAQTFQDRNAVYGDNYLSVGNAMVGLFPNGVTLKTKDDFNRFHIFMLNIVKMSRYTNNWDKGGHQDSCHDGMVYLGMLESIDHDIANSAHLVVGGGGGAGTIPNAPNHGLTSQQDKGEKKS